MGFFRWVFLGGFFWVGFLLPTLPGAAGGTLGGRPALPALCRSCSCPPAAGTAAAAQSPPPVAPKQHFFKIN